MKGKNEMKDLKNYRDNFINHESIENQLSIGRYHITAFNWSGIQNKTSPALCVFRNNGKKPCVYKRYHTEQDRNEAMHRIIEKSKKEVAEKQIFENLKKEWANPYSIDNLLYCDWGWEQTNIDYYQIVKINKTTVTIKEIASEIISYNSSMSGTSRPIKGDFIGDDIVIRIQRTLIENDGHYTIQNSLKLPRPNRYLYPCTEKDTHSWSSWA